MANNHLLDGPIPGENWTSNPKNQPWKRPPEVVDPDKGVEVAIKQLTKRDTAYSLLTMIQAGVPIVQCAGIFLLSGVGVGKWSVDLALILAGPVTHMMKLMAEGYGIKYDMGLDDTVPPTINFFKAKAQIESNKVVSVVDDVKKQIDVFKAGAEQVQQNGKVGLQATNPVDLTKVGPAGETSGFMAGRSGPNQASQQPTPPMPSV